jgi:hypothetical protein
LFVAIARLGPSARGAVVDNLDQSSIKAFVERAVRSTICSRREHPIPGAASTRPAMRLQKVRSGRNSGKYYAVKHALPDLAKDGSITLMAGAYSMRPAFQWRGVRRVQRSDRGPWAVSRGRTGAYSRKRHLARHHRQ